MFIDHSREVEFEIKCPVCDETIAKCMAEYDGDPSVGIPYGWEVHNWELFNGSTVVEGKYYTEGFACGFADPADDYVCDGKVSMGDAADLAAETYEVMR